MTSRRFGNSARVIAGSWMACFAAVALEGCTSTVGSGIGEQGTGGTPATGAGGAKDNGRGTGGTGNGGSNGVGGELGMGGAITGEGGATGIGGANGGGGAKGAGGVIGGSGGRGAGGGLGAGGRPPGAGGSNPGVDGGVDPCTVTGALSGGTPHTSTNMSGNAGNGLNWTIWSNGSAGTITTYTTPAFSASWNNSGDFLARLGLQWNQSKTYDQYGTITAQFNETKTGNGGGYSYIGIYGWSVSPCVEFYIVDDSYNKLPVNPGGTTNKGTVTIDGGSYVLYTRQTSGTGGSKCPGTSNWVQYYSVRMASRHCGVISVTDHFNAWAAAGMPLGKMDQAQLLVEVGNGMGNIDFPIASVTTTQ